MVNKLSRRELSMKLLQSNRKNVILNSKLVILKELCKCCVKYIKLLGPAMDRRAFMMIREEDKDLRERLMALMSLKVCEIKLDLIDVRDDCGDQQLSESDGESSSSDVSLVNNNLTAMEANTNSAAIVAPVVSTTTSVVCKRGSPAKKWRHKSDGKLWKFLRDLLLNPATNPSLIRWERRADGVFKVVESARVAKMWGETKGNRKMTYEKLSRAMRYYYKSQVLLPVIGERLVYQFGPNAAD